MLRCFALFPVLVLAVGCRAPSKPSSTEQEQQARHRFLTSDPTVKDYWPCFSPDGRTVLFSRSVDGGKSWSLYTVPASGGPARKLDVASLPASATRPSWSSRSGRIAFTAEEPDGKATVWIVESNGGQAHRVTAEGLSEKAFYPSWYPEDDRLAVVDFGDGERGVVKSVDLELHTTVALTDPAHTLAGMPAVAPNGQIVAFAGRQNRGHAGDQSQNSIWLLEQGSKPRNILRQQGRTPAWSPDGQWLAFGSNSGSANALYAAFIVRADGSALRQVTEFDLDASHPVWSRDARALAVAARHTKALPAATGIALVPVD